MPPAPQSALTLKPSFTDAYNNMASALVQKGCIPQAMECYAAALRIDPNVVRLLPSSHLCERSCTCGMTSEGQCCGDKTESVHLACFNPLKHQWRRDTSPKLAPVCRRF